MKIYTKTGDAGKTSLVTGERVSKTDARLEAYGTADELNSYMGLLRAKVSDKAEIDEQLVLVQNLLFDLGAILAGATLTLDPECVKRIETWIDDFQQRLVPVHAFILPAGNERVAICHVCRTVARRLERQMVNMAEKGMIEMERNSTEFQFVNRLSDYLFVLARLIGDMDQVPVTIWKKSAAKN